MEQDIYKMTEEEEMLVGLHLEGKDPLGPLSLHAYISGAFHNKNSQPGGWQRSLAVTIANIIKRYYGKVALNSTDILCTTCLCVAWEECAESDQGAQPNSTGPGWMRCQLCATLQELRAARANTPQAFGAEGRVN